ncbi:MAG TPA: peptide-methionine (S)-S-oxide reductase MsrA [Gemmatimonadaceae bacterium]|jgi:peptide-methionine (S)-S-oxide reductase|nr:peptide-methionine (S)-S-oxide reductase MsrA [Gemmatimonadaceae bacterium]
MMRGLTRGLIGAGVLAAVSATAAAARPIEPPHAAPPPKTQTVVFAGGCFWGIQSVFQHVKGVVSATSGYAGGWKDKPDYEEVSSGATGHAESVRVVFDTSQVSFADLMRVFFTVAHDPTQLNRQGPDVGTQYRSAIFYMNDEQKDMAQAYIGQLNASHLYAKPIVTQVAKLKNFYRAEDYHQNYAELHPDQPYIVINDAPKVVNLKKNFPTFFTDKLAAHE